MMFLRVLISVIPTLLLAAPTAPSNLTLTPTSNAVSLFWQDNSADESGFKIFRNGVLVDVVEAGITTYVDTAIQSHSAYTYTVKATEDDINKPILGIFDNYIASDEEMQVSILGALSGDRDWVGIYPAIGGNAVSWGWVEQGDNLLSQRVASMPAGAYEAKLFFHNSYTEEASMGFEVGAHGVISPPQDGSFNNNTSDEVTLSINNNEIVKKISWYRPDNLSTNNKLPAILFAPGGLSGDADYNNYKNLLEKIASQGYVVYYVAHDYGNRYEDISEETYRGFKAIIDRHKDFIDRTRIGMIGFSSGASALIKVGHDLFSEVVEGGDYTYGSNGKFLFQLSPNIALGIENGDIENYPSNTYLLTQIYDHTPGIAANEQVPLYKNENENDPRTLIDIYNNISIGAVDKEFMIVRSNDNRLQAEHFTPRATDAETDDLDIYTIFRPFEALADAAFYKNMLSKEVALGARLSDVIDDIAITHSDDAKGLFIDNFAAPRGYGEYFYGCGGDGDSIYVRRTQCENAF